MKKEVLFVDSLWTFPAHIAGKPKTKGTRKKKKGGHEEGEECTIRNIGRKTGENTVLKIKGERYLKQKVEWSIVSSAMKKSGNIRSKTSLLDLVIENGFKGMTETEIS